MNLLIDRLPDMLVINNTEYKINTDFRISILYETMMLDNDVSINEKPLIALKLYFNEIPEDMLEALEAIMWFYSAGEDTKIAKGKNTGSKDRVYSFDYDASLIYSAFLGQYNIDLTEVNLHWWKFKALFSNLNDDCTLCKIMEYRAIKLEGLNKEQRDFYSKMKKRYRIPSSKNEDEKISAIKEALMGSGNLEGIL